MRALGRALAAAGLLAALPPTFAADVATSFSASATVVIGCTVVADTLNFGTYAAGAGAPTVLATSTISVTCAAGEAYTVGLDNGSNAQGIQRRMVRALAPVDYLDYNLYRDAARTQVWRDTPPTRVSGTGSGAPQISTVYGQLPGSQVVPLGGYADTVTVTVRT
jgi:spore coat protein U-like protein